MVHNLHKVGVVGKRLVQRFGLEETVVHPHFGIALIFGVKGVRYAHVQQKQIALVDGKVFVFHAVHHVVRIEIHQLDKLVRMQIDFVGHVIAYVDILFF